MFAVDHIIMNVVGPQKPNALRSFPFLLVLTVIALAFADVFGQTPELVAEFPFLNFTFPSSLDAENYVNLGYYKNSMPAGIKLSSTGDIYISVPRWKGSSVPATVRFDL